MRYRRIPESRSTSWWQFEDLIWANYFLSQHFFRISHIFCYKNVIFEFQPYFFKLKQNIWIYQKLCETKFVSRAYYPDIMVKKLNFRFSIVFFQIKKKNIHLIKKMLFTFSDLFVVNNFLLYCFFVFRNI